MTSSDRLCVVLEGRSIGRIDRRGRALRLTYDDEYLDDPDATLLSAAMRTPIREHTTGVVTAWLWGLLPDNADVLARWGRQFGVSVASPFPLLATQVGHDCAGAVQFSPPSSLGDLVDRPGAIDPLSDSDVAERLRELRADSTSWLGPGFTGQFSLGGAQAKTALSHSDADGWGQPRGAAPTTHILKPAVTGLEGHDLNEHLCLAAARHCGLVAARSRVESFEDQTAVVVDRYDRHRDGADVVRIHQEDLCQALGLPPSAKYQADGGPSPADVANLLRAVMPAKEAVEAIERFVEALAFNWIIAGTDAHAKNYSLLHSGQQTRLAPLYDIASALPYDQSDGHRLSLAMQLGGEYRLLVTDRPVTWVRIADDVGLPRDAVAQRVARLTREVGDAFAAVASAPRIAALGSDLPGRLVDAVTARAARCARVME
jgi:serine/threonine-protein kinase HipA